jgi:phosphomannomutase
VIFDGDADRVMFVDEKANFISPDLIIALLGHYFLNDKKGIVLQDIRTSKSVKEYLAPMGAEVHTWRVGRAFAARKLRELDGIFGGELAGHYYFRDFFYSDSGIMAALIVLELVATFKEQGKAFSEVMEEIKGYVTSGEVNFKIEQKSQAMEAVKEHFTKQEKPAEVMDFDGYRIEFQDWWLNIRPSNTEPYLRLVAEAKSQKLLDEKLKEIHQIIEKFQ